MIDITKEKLITLDELMKAVKKSRNTVMNWARGIGTENGKRLEMTKLGQSWYSSLEALNRFQNPLETQSYSRFISNDAKEALERLRKNHGLKRDPRKHKAA